MNLRRLIKFIIHKPRLIFIEIVRRNRFGRNTYISTNVMINKSRVGNYVFIAKDCVINSAQIGSYSSIGPAVQIGGMEHTYKDLSTSEFLVPNQIAGNITDIGEDVWIGAGAIIKQGIKIGRGAVIGANSFVTHDVEPYAIVYGLPGKFIRYRFPEEIINSLMASEYWKYNPDKAKTILVNIRKKHNI